MKYKPLKEDLIYDDENYQIYKKEVYVLGNLTATLDLIGIIITNANEIKKELDYLKFRKDKIKIVNEIISIFGKIKKEI